MFYQLKKNEIQHNIFESQNLKQQNRMRNHSVGRVLEIQWIILSILLIVFPSVCLSVCPSVFLSFFFEIIWWEGRHSLHAKSFHPPAKSKDSSLLCSHYHPYGERATSNHLFGRIAYDVEFFEGSFAFFENLRGGGPFFILHCIFITKFFKVFRGGTWGAPLPIFSIMCASMKRVIEILRGIFRNVLFCKSN